MDLEYATWDKNKIERVQTQFLKQILGCNYQTSNNMVRADTGSRPLINAIIKRFISYIKNIQTKKSLLCYDSVVFETENSELPNFYSFNKIFGLNVQELIMKSKGEVNKICNGNYDRFWSGKISLSPKAASFIKFKTNISIESHLALNFNIKHKKAISRLRLSNHPLIIEKGRHFKIDKHERKCYFCEDKIENEEHFLVNCPRYSPQRKILEDLCIELCTKYEDLTVEQKFIFLMTNENEANIKVLGKFIVNSLAVRKNLITCFFS